MFELKNINMSFAVKNALFAEEKRAEIIRDLNLAIGDEEIVAVVGESGCGKTTLGKIITGLLAPTSGKILYNGIDISSNKTKGHSSYRRDVQFIQQDSYAALNPARTIYQSLLAAIETYDPHIKKEDADKKIDELMRKVELVPPQQFLFKYPHQLSGGQRQRILMARALSLNAKLIVADEPVSMIDVSIRISILSLIATLNIQEKIAFVYITHDLATAKYIAKNGRICVMYLGDIVELGPISEVLHSPHHPYTQVLVRAVPVPDPAFRKANSELPLIGMEVTNMEKRNQGCSFAPRCPYATEKCLSKVGYTQIGNTKVRCCNLDKIPEWKL